MSQLHYDCNFKDQDQEIGQLSTSPVAKPHSIWQLKLLYVYVMMLQTANWMISYLLKAYLVKIVEIDTLKKEYITFFHPFYKAKDFSKWVFTLIVWQ